MNIRYFNFLSVILSLLIAMSGCEGGKNTEVTESVLSDQTEVGAAVPEKEFSELTKRSLISTGNTERIANVLEKAGNGEEITVAYLGGSITQGVGASDEKNCYAYKSYEMLAGKYASGGIDKVRYVNAGIAGTPSALGIVRLQKDVTDYYPDIVFVEFAVNDGCDDTSKCVYESLVKRLLESPSKPAVVLIFTVLESGYSAQEHMQAIGEYYDLGMISVSAAITPELEKGSMVFKGDYAEDEAHPNDKGHSMISEFIEYYFSEAEKTSAEEYRIPSEPLYGDQYADLYNIGENSGEISSMGAFEIKKASCFTYENAFVHNKDGGNEPLVFKAEFSKLMLCFRQNNSVKMGEAEIIIDGKASGKISSYNKNGWGNIETKTVFDSENASEHTVEIRMTADDSEKELWLLDIGCVK